MPHFLSVSPLQLLDLWDELHSAAAGTNRYGGDVMEFYFFRLMAQSPAAMHEDPLFDDDWYDAARNLHSICRLFEARHEVTVVFEGGQDLDLLLDKGNLNRHRTHLRVIHRDAA